MSQLNSKKSKQNTDGWADLLSRVLVTKGKEPPGDGWKTGSEIAALKKCGISHAGHMMREFKKMGLAEAFKGSKFVNGRIRACTWYRPTQKGTK